MFCPKCGSILIPKKEDKKGVSCSCGYKSQDSEEVVIKEHVLKDEKDIEVIDQGELQTLPLTEVDCPKCKHEKAYYWLVQTRASDEPQTKFLRCEKCEHTWRDYD
tara:strand:- start:162 stop:476 length:315 start_codon:yes stop_codon:yes gene_type:complete